MLCYFILFYYQIRNWGLVRFTDILQANNIKVLDSGLFFVGTQNIYKHHHWVAVCAIVAWDVWSHVHPRDIECENIKKAQQEHGITFFI